MTMTKAEAGRKGYDAMTARYSAAQRREWAKLGGRPRNPSYEDIISGATTVPAAALARVNSYFGRKRLSPITPLDMERPGSGMPGPSATNHGGSQKW